MATSSNKRRDIRSRLSCPVYYSNGEFHASGMIENLTNHGGCLRGTHLVRVGMELMMLLIPPDRRALIVKKATVRWVDDAHFGVELNERDCGTVGELGDATLKRQQGLISMMSQ
jgi:hypothetical protein